MENLRRRPRVSQAAAAAVIASMLAACGQSDPNGKPEYGSTGLPANCRAYVQAAIDQFRAGAYTATETMNALERNCGLHGHSWSRE